MSESDTMQSESGAIEKILGSSKQERTGVERVVLLKAEWLI